MRKVLATSPRGRTLVAFGWVDVRVVDEAGVRGATRVDPNFAAYLKSEPDALDFIDLNYYGPPTR